MQVSADLQRVAAISNHLISTMASFLRWEPEPQVMSFIERPDVNKFNALTSAQMYEDNLKQILCAVCTFVKTIQDPMALAVITHSSNDS